VVIYRANPDQKATVVEFFRKNSKTKGKTLAIGDGINDVAMI
jgi:P-type E1-E2 ATPase